MDIDKSYAEGNNYSIIDNYGFGLTIDWDLAGGMNLKSITAYRELDAQFGQDQDGAPIQIIDPSFDTHQEQVSQELQLSGRAFDRLDWLGGLYYFQEDGDLTDFVTFPGGLLQIFGENFFDNEAWAAFTHLNFAVTDRFSLTLGARYTDEHKEFEGKQRDLNELLIKLLVTPPTSPPYPDPNDLTRFYPLGVNVKDFTDTSLRAGAEFRFTDEIMGYVSYSEGFKSGGWTTRLSFPHTTIEANPPTNPDRLDFDEETATTYEAGVKSELFDRRLLLNGAVFFSDYENIQSLVQQGISPVFANVGDGEISGLEVEFTGLVTDNLTLTGSLGIWTPNTPASIPASFRWPSSIRSPSIWTTNSSTPPSSPGTSAASTGFRFSPVRTCAAGGLHIQGRDRERRDEQRPAGAGCDRSRERIAELHRRRRSMVRAGRRTKPHRRAVHHERLQERWRRRHFRQLFATDGVVRYFALVALAILERLRAPPATSCKSAGSCDT